MPKTCTPAPKITLHASATGKTHLGVLKIPTYAPPHEFQKKVAFSLSHCLPSNAIQHIHIPFPTTSKNQFPCRVAALKFQPTRTHIYNEYYLAIYHPRARAAVYLPPKVFVRRALSIHMRIIRRITRGTTGAFNYFSLSLLRRCSIRVCIIVAR